MVHLHAYNEPTELTQLCPATSGESKNATRKHDDVIKISETSSVHLFKEARDDFAYGRQKTSSVLEKALVMTSCLLLLVEASGLCYSLGVMFVEEMGVFHVDRTVGSFVQCLNSGITGVGAILWGPFVKHRGPGPSIVFGCFVLSLGLFVGAFCTNAFMFIVVVGILGGIGNSAYYFAPFIVIGRTFRENPSIPIILLSIGSYVGILVIPPVYEHLLDVYGFSGSIILLSGVTLQCLPCGLIICYSKHCALEVDDSSSPLSEPCGDCSILSDPAILLALFDAFLISETSILESWFIVDIMELRGYTRAAGALMISIMAIAGLGGCFLAALLRAIFDAPTIYHWIYMPLIVAVCHILILKSSSYWPLLISCVVFGVTFGVTMAQLPAIICEVTGYERYTQATLYQCMMHGIANVVTIPIAGLIKDTYGTYDLMFYIAAASCLVIAVTAFIISRLLKKKEAAKYANILEIE